MKATLLLLLFFAQEFAFAQINKAAYLAKRDSLLCITQTKLFEYSQVDTIFQLIKKPAIVNFIAAIKACGYGYRYDSGFEDKACQLLLPKWLDGYSLGFSDNDFFISFDDHNTASGICIVLFYDLKEECQQIFFRQMLQPGQQYDSSITDGKIMYRFRNCKGIYVGEIFLDNKISIAYYTSEAKTEEQLRTCILSCRLE
jgi:hypothetical protein